MDDVFIVAEISKNWRGDAEMAPTGPICKQFETVINVNLRRGYLLHSFQLHRVFQGDEINETIIAVFARLPQLGFPIDPSVRPS